MRYCDLVFACAVALIMPAVANSADTPNTDGGIAGAKAGTEIEKAVGGSDTLSEKDLSSAVMATSVSNGARILASAKVEDMQGNIIGPVRKVTTGTRGKVDTVHVDVGGWLGIGVRVVSINASNFKYIAKRNILVTSLTKKQVEDMTPVKD